MYQLGIVGVVVALAVFLVFAGVILMRLSAARKKEDPGKIDGFIILSMGAFILSSLVNSAAIYLSYKFSIGVVDLGGLFFVFAIYAAVIMSVFLSFYYMISTVRVLLQVKEARN